MLGISGTGFFISGDGLFATACHVIDNIQTDATVFSAGNCNTSPKHPHT